MSFLLRVVGEMAEVDWNDEFPDQNVLTMEDFPIHQQVAHDDTWFESVVIWIMLNPTDVRRKAGEDNGRRRSRSARSIV